MIARKKRKLIIIVSIVLVVILIGVTIALLYINTDMFKSNKTLFLKYVGKNMDNLQEVTTNMYENVETTEFEAELQEKFYNNDTTMKVNYIENKGTSLENNNNILNQIQLNINTKENRETDYEYKNIKLIENEENLLNIEYVEENENCGIKIEGIQDEYLIGQNISLEQMLQMFGNTAENIIEVPDLNVAFTEIVDILTMTEDEQLTMQNEIIDLLTRTLPESNFSKQSNVTIVVDEKNVYADAYIVTLTKEQLNTVILEYLENKKQDEILLSKADQIEEILEENFGIINNGISLRESILEKIEEEIEEINKNNIGQEETKIIVYENQKNTVKTEIQTNEYIIILDYLKEQDSCFLEFKVEEGTETNAYIIRTSNGNLTLEKEEIQNEEIKTITISKTKKIENEICQENLTATYEDSNNKVEANIQSQTSSITESDTIKYDSGNGIIITDLQGEELDSIINSTTEAINTKVEEIVNVKLPISEIEKPLITAGILKAENKIESTGVSEAEKVRYNSQFEIFKGEKLSGNNVLNIIDGIKNNLNGLEVVSNNEIKLIIDRNNKNDEVISTLNEFIEKNRNREYNVDVQYDENGLVNSMTVVLLEKE